MSNSCDIGVYIHIPFCVKKCPYCDFNSYGIGGQHAGNGFADAEASYTKALLRELQQAAGEKAWAESIVQTIFFGGGTPSLFSGESIATILSELGRHFVLGPDPEVTLECNPGTLQEELGQDKLRSFFAAGVNRLSLGAQSFSESRLQFLGRIHSPDDTKRVCEAAKLAGISNFNLDLIFGTEADQLADWKGELTQALELKPKHLSCYGLTIEPGTEFFKRTVLGERFTASDDIQAELYLLTQQYLGRAGFRQYEISNYALPEFECQHNLTYWTRQPYLGLGAGAHTFCGNTPTAPWGVRRSNEKNPSRYEERAFTTGNATVFEETISETEAETEFFLLGLRLARGITTTEYQARFGRDLKNHYGPMIEKLVTEKLLAFDDITLRLTERGFLFADHVLAQFVR